MPGHTTRAGSKRIVRLYSSEKTVLTNNVRDRQAEPQALEQTRTEPIAIIGMGCRFPGDVHTPEAFWQLLRDGVDAMQPIPPSRWDIEAYYDPKPDTPGKSYVQVAGFLDEIDQFDAHFFGLSAREAIGLDPQQRLLLEVSWEALERAGLPATQLTGSQTGVFVGSFWDDYSGQRLYAAAPSQIDRYTMLSNQRGFAAGRLAHVFNVHGPAMQVDTACSSSLLAVHLACQSLRNRECDLALAGGVSLFLSPAVMIGMSQMKALSPDGRSKTFDAKADGFGLGEGCGVVVLKRLADAMEDDDPIAAVIRGSAVNHDGRSNTITLPSVVAQQAVLRQALDNAGLKPHQVQYAEAHGTGTIMGDLIEVSALAKVYGQERRTPLAIGSVKTNFGHLAAAAGVAGLMKVVLALQHEEIPPHLHLTEPTPRISWQELPITVPTQPTAWTEQPRLAGVSSFGMTGTNVHLIVEAAPQRIEQRGGEVSPTLQMFTLSTKTEGALVELATRYQQHLAQTHQPLGDICFTANTGRAHFTHRLAVAVESNEQLREQLTNFVSGRPPSGVVCGQASIRKPPKIAFLFSGQGTQYEGMGRELYTTQPTFRQLLDRCDDILRPYLKTSLLDVLYPQGREPSSVDSEQPMMPTPHAPFPTPQLYQTAYTQPALFALEYALAELWKSWGVEPDFVMGHSVGEMVAACVAGVFSLEDGLKLVAERGRLMQALPTDGEMVIAMADHQRIQAAIAPYRAEVSIAAINGPHNVVIAGRDKAIQAIVKTLAAAAIKTRSLTVSHPFHSPLMTPMLEAFADVAQTISYAPPKIAVVSNVTGKRVIDEMTKPDYWVRHVREAVRFADGMATLHEEGTDIFLEIGPQPTLLGMGRQCLADLEPQPPSVKRRASNAWLPSLRPGRSDRQQMLDSLGALYVQGVDVDWRGFDYGHAADAEAPRVPHKVVLPTYPFQRQRYWADVPKNQRTQGATNEGLGPLIDKMTKSPLLQGTLFETAFSVAALPFLSDHRVYDAVVAPGACHLAMILSAAGLLFSGQGCVLEDVIFPEALVVPEDGACTVQLMLTPESNKGSKSSTAFQLISFNAEGDMKHPACHATGRVVEYADSEPGWCSLKALRERCAESIAVEARYQAAAEQQIALGPSFRWLDSLWRLGSSISAEYRSSGHPPTAHNDEVLGRLRLPEAIGTLAGYRLHPGLLDACLQVASVAQPQTEMQETYLPFAVETLHVYKPASGDEWWCHARQVADHKWDIQLIEGSGQVVADVAGFEMRAASPEAVHAAQPCKEWLYAVEWQQRAVFGLHADYLPTPEQLQMTADMSHLRTQTDVLREAETSNGALPQDISAPPTGTHQRVDTLGQALNRYAEALTHLEAVSIDYVLAAFAKAGLTFASGSRWRTAQIIQQLGVVPHYHRLLERLLVMLSEEGILQPDGDTWHILQVPIMRDPQQRMSALVAQYGMPELTMVERCGAQLSEVLRGLQDPLELLFPGGDANIAFRLYHEAPNAQAMNELVQQTVLAAIDQLPTERGVRILEIGAGTGGTTAQLLPHLPAAQTEYVFTDIGARFTMQAQEKFAAYDFVAYQKLDIEQSPVKQGFGRQQYDIVIAANVLHATRNLNETLNHVQQLLAPGGLLVLLEATARRRWIDLTFGLTDGWWRFADGRSGHPLLTVDQWQQRLLESGFQSVSVLPNEPNLDTLLGQSLIIAQGSDMFTSQDRPWLILADEMGVGAEMAEKLRLRGEPSIVVYADHEYQTVNEQIFRIRLDVAEDYRRLLAVLPAVVGVIHLWSLDAPIIENAEDLEVTVRRGSGSVLYLLQALLQHPSAVELPRFCLVTQGAQAVCDDDVLSGFAQAGLWGMGRVIALEHPELRCVCIDMGVGSTVVEQAVALGAEIMSESPCRPREEQVALRNGRRYVARLMRCPQPTAIGVPNGPFRLETGEHGTLDSLQLCAVERKAPSWGEVEIRVRATGLNFRDVLNALGLYPGDAGFVGSECAGVVVAIGEGVEAFRVNDAVIAIAPYSFGQYVTVSADQVIHKPEHLSHEAAATIPVAFLTAYYCLHHLSQIKAGDRVLIHTATGGVGQAAIQIAQQAGAEVFGTASPAKWSALQALGVKHIYNSRTPDFAEAVLSDTDRQGVDIVLNTLTGAGFIEQSLATLAPQGRFAEISKRDVWDAVQVASVRPDVTYFLVDLLEEAKRQPRLIPQMLHALQEHFEQRTLRPLPRTVFPIHDVVNAFRTMQQAKHVGKIVVRQPATHEVVIRDHATYLITGGLGGLGLLAAHWLVEQGARHLVLMGRSQPKPEAQRQLDELAQMGVGVTVAQADVMNMRQVADVLAGIAAAYPLRGIIHAAGVLDDGALVNQTWERFERVMGPKIWGGWNLHQLTQKRELDFLVLYSSISGLLGNWGQANHAAGSVCLDALAHYRKAQELPALSIDWGVSDIGAGARMSDRERQRLLAQGQGIIAPERSVQVLAALLQQDAAQVGVMPIDWGRFSTSLERPSSFLAAFTMPSTVHMSQAVEQPSGFRQQLVEAPVERRQALLVEHLRSMTARVLGIRQLQQIDLRQGLMELGLDSLMSVELRNHLVNSLELRLPSTLLFDYPTLEALAIYLLQRLFPLPDRSEVNLETERLTPSSPERRLDELAQNEITTSIDAELEKLAILLKAQDG